jgi:uroporphyrin-III C-methyltransferase/precorrin-2 dehydrogenase/sirohydrochlorin ferrochelatase
MSSSSLYPLGLRLSGRKVLVVGGGAVATRRVRALVAAGAAVTVISPALTDELAQLHHDGRITVLSRTYAAGDVTTGALSGALLVHTATGVTTVDAEVTHEADAAGILVVNAADAQLSSAWVPAITSNDDLTVAVFGGADPGRAVAVRDAVAALLEGGQLPTERRRAQSAATAGSVALVGGGPGPDDLITVRGLKLIQNADVIVADRLGAVGLLADLPEHVEIVHVGKAPTNHPVPQDEINAILAERAQRGLRVVRLKGGDPYVFGRGGEELAYLLERGVAVEVVPGITSAVSVPSRAGIPVTHRGVATSFTVVTGHEPVQDITGAGDHTVVILMGIGTLAESAANLASGERGAQCPVAIIEDGYGVRERITISTLGEVAQVAQDLSIAAPAIIIVGNVVRLAPQFS